MYVSICDYQNQNRYSTTDDSAADSPVCFNSFTVKCRIFTFFGWLAEAYVMKPKTAN